MGSTAPMDKARLMQAVDTLAQELLLIKSSLDTYRLIGLNASNVESGKLVLGHLQRLSLSSVALGLAKVYEREKENGYELCSVSGVFRLAKSVPVENIAAVRAFSGSTESSLRTIGSKKSKRCSRGSGRLSRATWDG